MSTQDRVDRENMYKNTRAKSIYVILKVRQMLIVAVVRVAQLRFWGPDKKVNMGN